MSTDKFVSYTHNIGLRYSLYSWIMIISQNYHIIFVGLVVTCFWSIQLIRPDINQLIHLELYSTMNNRPYYHADVEGRVPFQCNGTIIIAQQSPPPLPPPIPSSSQSIYNHIFGCPLHATTTCNNFVCAFEQCVQIFGEFHRSAPIFPLNCSDLHLSIHSILHLHSSWSVIEQWIAHSVYVCVCVCISFFFHLHYD
jgi:hypothetical protein